jgi:hypothetical protein
MSPRDARGHGSGDKGAGQADLARRLRETYAERERLLAEAAARRAAEQQAAIKAARAARKLAANRAKRGKR